MARYAWPVIAAASRVSVGRHGIQCRLAPAVTSAYGPPSGASSAAPVIQRKAGWSPPGRRRPVATIAADISTAST
jgi:hypothetical protein